MESIANTFPLPPPLLCLPATPELNPHPPPYPPCWLPASGDTRVSTGVLFRNHFKMIVIKSKSPSKFIIIIRERGAASSQKHSENPYLQPPPTNN